jgi:hypothetical protein
MDKWARSGRKVRNEESATPFPKSGPSVKSVVNSLAFFKIALMKIM